MSTTSTLQHCNALCHPPFDNIAIWYYTLVAALELGLEMENKIFSTGQAAEYVGLHRQTFKFHIYKGHITPAGRIGKNLFFLQKDLDEFKGKWSESIRVARLKRPSSLGSRR